MSKKKQTQYDIERQNHEKPIEITLKTRVPSKYRICDLETNQIWKWDESRDEFVVAELPLTFPNFGDKANIMNKVREFTINVENALAQYNRCFDYDHSKPVDIIQLGMDVTKALDKMRTSLLLWKIELDSWYKGLAVEQLINGRNEGKNENNSNL